MIKEAVVLAGGLGTRLRSVVDQKPKAMAVVRERPFLEFQLDYLIEQGIERVVLSIGYLAEQIKDHFGTSYRSLELDYAFEKEPLGTGGGMRLAAKKIKGDWLFALNGDTLFEVDLPAFNNAFNQTDMELGVCLRAVNDLSRYGAVILDDKKIDKFTEKGSKKGKGLINGGIYCFRKELLMSFPDNTKFSFEKEILEKTKDRQMFGYPVSSYFLDIGIPEDYEKAQHEFERFED